MVGTKIVKTSLKRIFIGTDKHLENIQKYIRFANCLETTVSQFVRWYYLKCDDTDPPLPPTESFYGVVIRAFSHGRKRKAPKKDNMKTKMIAAHVMPYIDEFQKKRFYVENTEDEPPVGFWQSISYMQTVFNTNTTTNVKMHFMGKACTYIALRLEKKKRIKMINDDLRKGTITENEAKSIRSKLFTIIKIEREAFDVLYKDIKDVDENTVESKYLPTASDVNTLRKELKEVIKCILDHEFQTPPDVKKRKTSTTTITDILIHYDVCCSPEEYVPAYLRLSRLYETMNAPYIDYVMKHKDDDSNSNDDDIPTKYPPFNFLPLKRSLVPGHVKFDTHILRAAILEGGNPENKIPEVTPTNHMHLWGRVVNLKNKAFRPLRGGTYEFRGSILTDGISVSVILQLQSAAGGKCGKRKRSDKKKKEERYITDPGFRIEIRKKKVVVIDPNKRDLVFCMHEDSKSEHPMTMRYTSSRRRRDTKVRQTNARRKKIIGKAEKINSAIPVSTTVNVKKFEEFLIAKKDQRDKLLATYENETFRRLRLNTYINTRRSEDHFMNEFKKKFGGKDDVVVVFGNWSDGGHTMKNQATTKGKGMRDVFRRTKNYVVRLVDEFCTSKKCSSCGKDLEKCDDFKRPSSRPWMRAKGKTEVPHGLLRCKNVNCQASLEDGTSKFRLWNRDVNATINMLACVDAVRKKRSRPIFLTRNSSVVINVIDT